MSRESTAVNDSKKRGSDGSWRAVKSPLNGRSMTGVGVCSSSMSAAKQNGCDGYLVKPIRKGDLCDELEKLGLIPCEAADGRS